VIPFDLKDGPFLADEPHQGIINHHALVRMLKGRFAKDTDPRYTQAGAPYYDPKRIYYTGNSQGGTIGNVNISTSADLERAVLGVPGTALAFLVSRASQFLMIEQLLSQRYTGSRDIEVILGLVQMGFGKFEPTHFVRRVTEDPFPGTPPKRVLLQVAREDAQVHNDISAFLGRVIGATLVEPYVRPVWGLPSAPPPIAGNAYAEYDFKVPLSTRPNYPADPATDTHSLPRKLKEAQDQLWHFLETGEAIHTCDGICDPN
jgi:hypothetical protein